MAASSITTKPFLGANNPNSSYIQRLSFSSLSIAIKPRRSHQKFQIQAAGSAFGNYFRVTTFGESHGGGLGCVVDGCPPRIPLSEPDLQVDLDRRRLGQTRITTPRTETDICRIYSGVSQGVTIGTPIHVFVPNTDERGDDYREMSIAYRPSHADFTYDSKYGIREVQGGGRSSARETIGRVIPGAIAKKILKQFSGTEILAYVSQVHQVVIPDGSVDHDTVTLDQIESSMVRCPNPEYAEKMMAAIDAVRTRGDSIGGVVTCIVRNAPRGLGSPVFDKLEAELAKALMSIPAIKGFEIGSGFAGTFLTGSEHNDEFFTDEHGRIRTRTNRSGGIQGGISNGEIINMRVALKPTATIAKKQRTVTRYKKETELSARLRHNPCVVPRAVPVVEAMVALVLVDQLMAQHAQCNLFPINPELQEPMSLNFSDPEPAFVKERHHLVWQYEVYEARIEARYISKRREQFESNSKRFGWFYAYLPLFRYVASELETDIAVTVGDVKFFLHKFPLLSKSARLQNLVVTSIEENCDEVQISDIPGGPVAFEICAKFCYGMTINLNAYNVVATRCAAEYLGMYETLEKGNLIYKIDIFLNSSIFHSWKDSIIVLQTTNSMLPLSEELKVASLCIDAIATNACIHVSKVDWSYTYNRRKLPEENENDPKCNGVKSRPVPTDWWVEDLCELEIDLFKRVIMSIKTKGILSHDVIGEALKAYSYRRLQGFSKGVIHSGDVGKYQSTVDTMIWLLPAEKGSVSCSFLLKLLKAAIVFDSGNMAREQLMRRIGQQLEEASVNDLLIRAGQGEDATYDVDTVQKIVKEFLMQDQAVGFESEEYEVQEIRRLGILTDASKLIVAKLIDAYLAEIAKDPNLPLSKFVDLAEMVSYISRPSHDRLYRAIDMYLKEHPWIGKSERKRICKLMDCKKLSADACKHAVQNERLSLRVAIQVLFFEQTRAAAASSGSSTPDLPKALKYPNSGPRESSRSSATDPEEEWDAVSASKELKALRAELAAIRLSNGVGVNAKSGRDSRNGIDQAAISKMKGLMKSKRMFTKIWSSKAAQGEHSGTDSSESFGSANPEEAKSTPSRNRRHSVS
ncbi:hypothetical protein V6N13_102732 [Hibiscus sabdariffa]